MRIKILFVYLILIITLLCANIPLTFASQVWTLVFSDDVESGNQKWTASGLWHITTYRRNSGSHSWAYNQESSHSYETGNNANSGILTSSQINLSDVTGARLKYITWRQTEPEQYVDLTRVEISKDGGITWSLLDEIAENIEWTMRSINLSSYIGCKILIRFSFDTIDELYNDYEGWYIDDIAVEVTTGDIIPPGNPSSFTITATERGVSLNWINPLDPDFAGVMVRRKTGSYPSDPSDGVEVFKGMGASVVDADIVNGITYYYKIYSFDSTGNFSPGITASVTPGWKIIFSDNIESGQGGWIATGLWHITEYRSNSANYSWGYNQKTSHNYDTQSANRGTLISPEIDLATASIAKIRYSILRKTEDNSSYDITKIEISKDSGLSWTTVDQPTGNILSWTAREFNLFPFLGNKILIRFSFDTIDENENLYEGWYIDDIVVEIFDASDIIPPANPSNFTAIAGNEEISLSWINPSDRDFSGVVIRRKITGYPDNPGDGIEIFKGKETEFKDTAVSNGVIYYYKIYSFDAVFNYSSGAPASATPGWKVIFSDNIESGQGGWIATGLWHITEYRSNSTVRCWAYNQESTHNYDTGDANQGILISPEIDLSSATSAKIRYSTLRETEPMSNSDISRVEISTDDGINWIILEELTEDIISWAPREIDLGDYLGLRAKIRFFFDTVNKWNNEYEGWYIDDIVVEIGVDTSPPTIEVLNPPDNSYVKGKILVEAKVKDNVSVDKVDFISKAIWNILILSFLIFMSGILQSH